MGTLRVRTDAAMETALDALVREHGTRTAAVRYALLTAHRDQQYARARADAERLAADPAERAVALEIQRFMGVGR
ncbi:hypothetical protein SRB5_43660 [Streptomyces sp. RB5]|uniref:Uncharacterized protein n=1 Tax=Streptomyces smaragdinus TaxID=2585196 RepID=A0A7K0CN62_9ACTN|nr:hypothetical protein [Streptomyces smaragdinus]MQY14204.1 hypothetical protein [Streptomyces smaragdinus]